MANKTRQFIRHPSEIPIELWCILSKSTTQKESLCNVSLSGLAFKSNVSWEIGTIIGVRIPLIHPIFETICRVVWCHKKHNNFEIGVELMDIDEAFKVRMVEQVCQIENYRNKLKKQGRDLSIEEAATEWINRYAAVFPSLDLDNID
jgi:hypothetical protein